MSIVSSPRSPQRDRAITPGYSRVSETSSPRASSAIVSAPSRPNAGSFFQV